MIDKPFDLKCTGTGITLNTRFSFLAAQATLPQRALLRDEENNNQPCCSLARFSALDRDDSMKVENKKQARKVTIVNCEDNVTKPRGILRPAVLRLDQEPQNRHMKWKLQQIIKDRQEVQRRHMQIVNYFKTIEQGQRHSDIGRWQQQRQPMRPHQNYGFPYHQGQRFSNNGRWHLQRQMMPQYRNQDYHYVNGPQGQQQLCNIQQDMIRNQQQAFLLRNYRRGAFQQVRPRVTREQLDAELEQYMSSARTALDRQLDEYISS